MNVCVDVVVVHTVVVHSVVVHTVVVHSVVVHTVVHAVLNAILQVIVHVLDVIDTFVVVVVNIDVGVCISRRRIGRNTSLRLILRFPLSLSSNLNLISLFLNYTRICFINGSWRRSSTRTLSIRIGKVVFCIRPGDSIGGIRGSCLFPSEFFGMHPGSETESFTCGCGCSCSCRCSGECECRYSAMMIALHQD